MKKPAKSRGPRLLDKHLFEAGQQCHKRLWLDCHEPVAPAPSPMRQEMSRVGDELRDLARTAFPKGVTVEGDDAKARAEHTRALLDDDTPVLFDATFVHDGVVVQSDVLVAHKDDEVDLFEIKSGTKVKHRYVNDLAMQAVVLERCGLRLKRAYLLHVNPKYAHVEGQDFPPMQLLRSADVTAKVEKQVPNVTRRIDLLRAAMDDEAALELPMGTFCRSPFPCPHLARCRAEGPARPLHLLPELTRQLELELHKEGIEDLDALPTEHEGLSFRQRRTLAAVKANERIVEEFLAEELRDCEKPLHFVAMAAQTEPLPRFDQQHPWQLLPYAWVAQTVHEDGRVERAAFVHADRDDPRGPFLESLARHLEVGGTLLCWDDTVLRELRSLLDTVPGAKAAVRQLMGTDHLDMRALFEASVFDPALLDLRDLRDVAAVLLDDASGRDVEMLDDATRYEAVQKARAPRVRAATREKIAAAIEAAAAWQAEKLVALYEQFAGVETPRPREATAGRRPAAKPLPKLPE